MRNKILMLLCSAFLLIGATTTSYAQDPTTVIALDDSPDTFAYEAGGQSESNLAVLANFPSTGDAVQESAPTHWIVKWGGTIVAVTTAIIEVLFRFIPATTNYTPLTILYRFFGLIMRNNAGHGQSLVLTKQRE